jgi:hypothetical protein
MLENTKFTIINPNCNKLLSLTLQLNLFDIVLDKCSLDSDGITVSISSYTIVDKHSGLSYIFSLKYPYPLGSNKYHISFDRYHKYY